MKLTGQMIFESLPHGKDWQDLLETSRETFDASAGTLNQQLEAGDMLQKKVLMYLLKGLRQELQQTPCAEGAVSGLTDQERVDLTEALYKMWGEIDDWDGTASDEFSLSSLCRLALTWVGSA